MCCKERKYMERNADCYHTISSGDITAQTQFKQKSVPEIDTHLGKHVLHP